VEATTNKFQESLAINWVSRATGNAQLVNTFQSRPAQKVCFKALIALD
jgi:hypothetical protein